MLRYLLIISVALSPLQDIGGSLAFQGQDIIGGAAVIFKAPRRVRDIVGGAASMMAVRRPPRAGRSTTVARNTTTRPATQPTTADASTATATNDRVEALINQGNTYYDAGQFAQALDA